jgi:hypothetical protein
MKKIIFTLTFVFVLATGVFGQTTQEGFPDLKAYANAYLAQFGWIETDWINKPKIQDRDLVENAKYAALEGNQRYIDTLLELAIYAYCHPKANTAPPTAEAILPHNNPRLVDRQLGAYVYKGLIVYRFLNDTAAVNRHEAVLQFITGRGNATRAEIEQFYRDNVRTLIAAVVDEEFNKISFSMSNDGIRKGYNALLTRTANNQYILEYEGVYQGKDFHEKLPATPLDALLTQMRNNTADFDQACVNTVRAQAALIPAVARPADINKVVNAIVAFYTSPSAGTFEEFKRIYNGYRIQDLTERAARDSFMESLYALNPAINERLYRDSQR